MEKSRMMGNEKYQALKTDTAHNQLKALHAIVRNVGESIDDAVHQMTYAMDLSHQVKSWMTKWVDEDVVTENDLSESKKLAAQMTAILSGLQSMSSIMDKTWMKSRKFIDYMPAELKDEKLDK